MSSPQRIALVLPERAVFGLRILHGVSTYARPSKPWILHTMPMQPDVISLLRKWKPTGVIAFLGTRKMHSAFARTRWPVVNVSNSVEKTKMPCVISGDYEAGKMAAEHFIERGFRHFAFCGKNLTAYAQQRCAGFRDVIQGKNLHYQEYEQSFAEQSADVFGDWTSTSIDENLGKWLLQLPKPVAVFASQDYIAFVLSEVCRQFDIRVPEDVALIGVDDDEMVCESARPPLSSIRASMEQIGYEAAHMLDQILSGQTLAETRLVLAPKGVVPRQSTDIITTQDQDLSMALQFIREHADKPVSVQDVLDKVLISRRSLENKMKRLIGRTPLDEIHRVHIERAGRLLAETDLPIERIATAAGFTSRARMDVVFRTKTGQSPKAYRQQNQSRAR